MFTIDTVVDTAVKSTKQITALVKETAIRKELDTLVDAQAAYTKTIYNTTLDLTKTAVEQFGKFDAKSLDLTTWFPAFKAAK